ncbi:MAG: hypothetical protein ACOC46_02955 [Pirellulales bacterium]
MGVVGVMIVAGVVMAGVLVAPVRGVLVTAMASVRVLVVDVRGIGRTFPCSGVLGCGFCGVAVVVMLVPDLATSFSVLMFTARVAHAVLPRPVPQPVVQIEDVPHA